MRELGEKRGSMDPTDPLLNPPLGAPGYDGSPSSDRTPGLPGLRGIKGYRGPLDGEKVKQANQVEMA